MSVWNQEWKTPAHWIQNVQIHGEVTLVNVDTDGEGMGSGSAKVRDTLRWIIGEE